MIKVSICVSDIDRSEIKEVDTKTGKKKYLNVVVSPRREKGRYGETHAVYLDQTKEQRQENKPKKYVGDGREFAIQQEQKVSDISSEEAADNLPF